MHVRLERTRIITHNIAFVSTRMQLLHTTGKGQDLQYRIQISRATSLVQTLANCERQCDEVDQTASTGAEVLSCIRFCRKDNSTFDAETKAKLNTLDLYGQAAVGAPLHQDVIVCPRKQHEFGYANAVQNRIDNVDILEVVADFCLRHERLSSAFSLQLRSSDL